MRSLPRWSSWRPRRRPTSPGRCWAWTGGYQSKPASTESNSHRGRGAADPGVGSCAVGHASTDALPPVLVAAFGSAPRIPICFARPVDPGLALAATGLAHYNVGATLKLGVG